MLSSVLETTAAASFHKKISAFVWYTGLFFYDLYLSFVDIFSARFQFVEYLCQLTWTGSIFRIFFYFHSLTGAYFRELCLHLVDVLCSNLSWTFGNGYLETSYRLSWKKCNNYRSLLDSSNSFLTDKTEKAIC